MSILTEQLSLKPPTRQQGNRWWRVASRHGLQLRLTWFSLELNDNQTNKVQTLCPHTHVNLLKVDQ